MSAFIVCEKKSPNIEIERFTAIGSVFEKAEKCAREYEKEYGKKAVVYYCPACDLEF